MLRIAQSTSGHVRSRRNQMTAFAIQHQHQPSSSSSSISSSSAFLQSSSILAHRFHASALAATPLVAASAIAVAPTSGALPPLPALKISTSASASSPSRPSSSIPQGNVLLAFAQQRHRLHTMAQAAKKPRLKIPHRVVTPNMPITAPARSASGRASSTRERERERTKDQEGTTTIVASSSTSSHKQADLPWARGGEGQSSTGAPSISTAETILKDQGLTDFIGRVYRVTGLSVAASLGIAYGLPFLVPMTAFGALQGAGFVLSIGSLLGMMFGTKPTTMKRPDGRLFTENSAFRKALYGGFVTGNAMSLAPAILVVSAINPMIVPASVAATLLTMGGASFYAMRKPNASLLPLAGPLVGALFGILGMQLLSMGALYFYGANAFSAALSTVYPYIGIGLFSAFTAVDTHTAVAEYQEGTADHLQHAVSFYLNFINLLVSFMRIFSSGD